MKYLVEKDEPDMVCGQPCNHACGTFETFAVADAARAKWQDTYGGTWNVWYIEYHFMGRAEGDRS